MIYDIHWEQGCLPLLDHKLEGILVDKTKSSELLISLQVKAKEWKVNLSKIKFIPELENIAELKTAGWPIGLLAGLL